MSRHSNHSTPAQTRTACLPVEVFRSKVHAQPWLLRLQEVWSSASVTYSRELKPVLTRWPAGQQANEAMKTVGRLPGSPPSEEARPLVGCSWRTFSETSGG